MSEYQWFEREVSHIYTDYTGKEFLVVCGVKGRLENSFHVPCAGKVAVYDEEGNNRPRVFEIHAAHITDHGSALGHQVIVADHNLPSYFELMAFAMKALGEMMCEEISTYWRNFPNDYEKRGTWQPD